MKAHDIIHIDIKNIKEYKFNARLHNTMQIEQIKNSIKEFGFTTPLIVDSNYNLIAGHGRLNAIMELNKIDFSHKPILKLPCVIINNLNENQIKALRIVDNQITLNSSWDLELLQKDIIELNNDAFPLDLLSFDNNVLDNLLNNMNNKNDGLHGLINNNIDNNDNKSNWDNTYTTGYSIADRFKAPPFSIFNSIKHQNECAEWVERGIVKGGRPEDLGQSSNLMKNIRPNTKIKSYSLFNPFLCECLHYWFNIDNGKTLDPFAGGMERGFVSCYLNNEYMGFEVRPEQIEFNINNCNLTNLKPKWILDTSVNMFNYVEKESHDFILSCPPYANLEVYSDLEDDISNKPYSEFLLIYNDIINNCYKALKNNRFCIFVVGEVRDKNGAYINFVGDTIQTFLNAGFVYYNELILINNCGTGALRITNQFNNSRKLFKHHQNVLMFYKGNLKDIKDNFKELNYSE